MPIVNCPIAECTYAADDLDAIIVADLITTHAMSHTIALSVPGDNNTIRVEKVKRHTITSAGTSEDLFQIPLDRLCSSH